MKKICLYTAHSPLGGGGSVILQSLVKNLPEFNICWKYTSVKAVPGYEDGYMGNSFMGGSIVKDIWKTWRMLDDRSCADINNIVKKLLSVDCDSYWIVSHNEGIRIALEIARIQKEKPVHLTIHDDWSGALSARSFRYHFMADNAIRLTIKTLTQVSSFDVISSGMQKYYYELSARKGEICHRYLSPDSIRSYILDKNTSAINAGHIGSIYSKSEFFEFMYIFKAFAKKLGKKPIMHMWGYHPKNNSIPKEIRDNIILYPDLPEREVIPKLANCSFVYAMYPMANKMRKFSQTSLPTKLTSYVQAAIPIFGHGPSDSTLAEFLHKTGTGMLWSSRIKNDGIKALTEIMSLCPSQFQWNYARKHYFGENNLIVMQKLLSNPKEEIEKAQIED